MFVFFQLCFLELGLNNLDIQVLAEREAESKEIRLNILELEANTNDLHAKFEAALAHLERESEEKDAEVESLNETIKKLYEQIYNLEDENDRMKGYHERQREDNAIEWERLEVLSTALEEVLHSFIPPTHLNPLLISRKYPP
jgi:peptidoglycan hydrolase CwlO-like protein